MAARSAGAELGAGLLLSLVISAATPCIASAQQVTQQQKASADADALKQRDEELGSIRADQKKSAETIRKFESDLDAAGEERRKLNQSLIDTASRIRAVEERIAATETRLMPLDDSERDLRASPG